MQTSKFLFLLLVALLLGGCASVDSSEIENLNDGKILALGHAGMGFTSYMNPFNPYPPNGFTALKKAMELGADGLEVDVQMTEDSILVLFHDMTMGSSTALDGCVREKQWSKLRNTDYEKGLLFDAYHDDRILSLDTLLGWLSTFPEFPHLHLDIRSYNMCNTENPDEGYEIMARKILAELDAHKVPADRILLISTSWMFVDHLALLGSQYPLCYEETADFQNGIKGTLSRGLEYLTIKPKLISKAKVNVAHKFGVKIITFGGKSKQGAVDLIRLDPDVIHANNLKGLKELLEEE